MCKKSTKLLVVVANTSEKSFRGTSQQLQQSPASPRIKTLCIGKKKDENVAAVKDTTRHIFAFDSTVPKAVVTSYTNSLRETHPDAQYLSVGQRVNDLTMVQNWSAVTAMLN